ncbi:MAG: Hpt domain-containing protein [Ilumatobacteraceae bacterium]
MSGVRSPDVVPQGGEAYTMVNDVDEVVTEFLVESYENLDRLDQDLVKLEDDPKQHGTLASVFRTIHTIKGTCGFLGYTKLEKVAHVGENLLSRLRDGTLDLDEPKMSALLTMVDAVRDARGHRVDRRRRR